MGSAVSSQHLVFQGICHMLAPETQPTAPQGEISLRVLAMPADTNAAGNIFGGWVMAQMDMAGAMYVATLTCQQHVTVAVDGMKFRKPVNVGDEVTCYTRTEKIGNTSVTIGIDVWVRNLHETQPVLVVSGTFIYVTIGDDGRPVPF